MKFLAAPQEEFCQSDACEKRVAVAAGRRDSYRGAAVILYILDRPVIFLCKKCAKDWSEMWIDNGGWEPEEIKRRKYPINKDKKKLLKAA